MAVKSPIVSGHDYLEDIAIFSGATLLSSELGHNLERANPVYVLGKCEKVEITKEQTIIMKGEGKKDQI